MPLDHSLLFEARKLITGANVHWMKTWILCYETSSPDSPRQAYYERLIREVVNYHERCCLTREKAEALRRYSTEICTNSDELNQQITKLRQ